ncbi:MAG: hypothetical protein IJD13_02675 [Oscillospiraceae bacterium]|nr:hypothetical protein [Oscillospiraceae bacterium]
MKKWFSHSAFSENPFRFYCENSVLHERDLGIAGDKVTVLTPEKAAAKINGIQNCPWSGSGFSMEIRIDGEQIPGRDWVWLPNAIRRSGKRGNWEVSSLCVIPPKKNGVILRTAFTNISSGAIEAPVQLIFDGGIIRTEDWTFPIPAAAERHYASFETSEEDGISFAELIGSCDDVDGCAYDGSAAMMCVSCSLSGMKHFRQADIWETVRTVEAGETLTVDISLHLGSQDSGIEAECRDAARDIGSHIASAFDWLEEETGRIRSTLPEFSSDLPALDALFYRSVVTYSLNRWENPNFAIFPFFSNGSINGGCMCTYLWDYGGALMLHPLIEPEVNKQMIKGFLHVDLTTSYAITPLDGSKAGPWYPVNQEKIINLIYFHILHTGDTDFLYETVDGRTIAEWAVFHALVCDDPTGPQKLVDYGKGSGSHLELRRRYPYKGVMPDLNARRYYNYIRAYRISCLAGEPNEMLLERAEALKPLLASLWDEEAGWYDHIWEGKRGKRWTIQMFKFLDSPVIDDHTREKLISHLNKNEFLSKFGMHSLAKTDPGYDQIDIDNGGGGSCTLFIAQICGQLYDMGYAALATDILKRVLWWGERLPYLGDSCAANMIEDREDTPLQANINSTACAQMLIFNMCGIKADFDGTVRITPAKVLPTKQIRLKNVRLRGKVFTLTIDGGEYTVETDGRRITAKLGETTVLA